MHKAAARQRKHSKEIKVGDRVAYSALWLKSVRGGHAIAARRGVVKQIGGEADADFVAHWTEFMVGDPIGETAAIVQWDDDDKPRLVNKYNLAKVGSTAFAEGPHMGKDLK